MDRDGRFRERGNWKVLAGCSWICAWAVLMLWSMFLFMVTDLRPTSSAPGTSPDDGLVSGSKSSCFDSFSSGMLEKRISLRNEELRNEEQGKGWSGDVRTLKTPWNALCFGDMPPEYLRIALFVKKWPVGGTPGGLERHAMTLHGALAQRGHDVHVFTMSSNKKTPEDLHEGNLHVHFVMPNENGGFHSSLAWKLYEEANASKPFDVVHSESVALPHYRARGVPNVVASWHGIAFEVAHTEIAQDLIRKPGEPRSIELQKSMTERLSRVADEVRFFHSYEHHIAISDFVSELLGTVYQLPGRNVHTILNGVDEMKFHPNLGIGDKFRAKYGVPVNAGIVLGVAGRLVKDKGHPLLFEAFREIIKERSDVYILIAGSGPWGERYKELGSNAITLGNLKPAELAEFYNALDIFVNPTLRAQGLDLTLLEAMQCGKPLLATKFQSITRSIVKSEDFGYTFSPNVDALIATLKDVIKDGKDKLRRKGVACREYASFMFTATKMASSYERLFLCMKNEIYCHYPLPHDCIPHRSKYLGAGSYSRPL